MAAVVDEPAIQVRNEDLPMKTAQVAFESTVDSERLDRLEEGGFSEDRSSEKALLDRKLFHIGWFLCGAIELLYLNSIISVINDVTHEFFPDYPRLSDTLVLTSTVIDFIVAAITVKRGYSNLKLNLWSGATFALLPLLTALVINVFPTVAAVVCLHILAGLGGGYIAAVQAGHYGLAGYMPVNNAAWVAGGIGVGGLISFLLYMFWSELVFRDSVMAAVWGQQVCVALLIAAAFSFVLWMSRIPDVKECFERARKNVLAHRAASDRVKFRTVALKHWPFLMIGLVNATHTYLIYPNIGPFRWEQPSLTHTNVLVGVFQGLGCIGSMMPAFSRTCPWAMWGKKTLIAMTLFKVLLTIPAILFWQLDGGFATSYAAQFIVLCIHTILDGWISTLAVITGPMTIKDEATRGSLTSLNVLALLAGLALGQILMKVVAFSVEGTF